MDINELSRFGIAPEIVQKWSSNGYKALLPVQEEAISKGVFDGNNLLVAAPTSSGKTFIGEMAATAFALHGKKSLYLVPFKALAEEKYLDFDDKYGTRGLGLVIRISDRDHRETDNEICVGNYDIAILTYEKLSGLLAVNPGILDSCDCVIVDEVQMMMDPDRGGNLELLITKILNASKIQIIALSAVLSNLNGLDQWLGAEVVTTKQRPVELRQGVVLEDGTYEYINWNDGTINSEKFNNGSLLGLVEELLANEEQIIIVCNTVPRTQRLALQLSQHFAKLRSSPRCLELLQTEKDTETRTDLLNTLRHGVAFHNSDCEPAERRIIEQGFRNGEIRIIVATTTLSMGVNMPCKTIILADNSKWATQRGSLQLVPWLVSEVRNIFGRAGRLGVAKDFGRGILLAGDRREYYQIMNGYVKAPLEPFKSSFENRDFALRVLDVAATGFGGSKDEIIDFIFKTFAAQSWTTTEAKEQIQKHIQNGIIKCIENELIQITSIDNLQVTELGKLCAAKGCSIESFAILSSYMKNIRGLDILDICFIASTVEEVDKFYYRGVRWNDGTRKEKVLFRINLLISGEELRGSIKKYCEGLGRRPNDDDSCHLTIALLARDIIGSKELSKEIKTQYNLSSANIRNICLNLSWILDIMSGIAEIYEPTLVHDIEILSESIKEESPWECRFLNRIGVNLSRDEKIRVIKAGYTSEDDFLDKTSSDFRGIINSNKANEIVKFVNDKRERNCEFWKRDHVRRLNLCGYDYSIISNLYSAKGIDLERAITDLINTGFAQCNASRITDQNKGEPDLLITFPSGETFTAQVTAKEENTKFVDAQKAGDVISQSASFHPKGYICIGRPDFQDLAKERAHELSKDLNYKLLPIFVLAELFVQVKEGYLSEDDAMKFLISEGGYLSIKKIFKLK